jgi:hypothetical protein
MSDIVVTPLRPSEYGVRVHEGADTTGHEVVLDLNLVDELGLSDYDGRLVTEEVVSFLLDRQPADSLGERIWLRDVDRLHPDFRDELVARVTARDRGV